MNSKQTKWFFLVVLALIWGSSFILIKRGLVGLTPYQLGAFRIIFAGLFLLSIGFNSLKSIPKQKWKYIALTALFGTFISAFLFSIAETKLDSSISAILNSLTPLNTLILGVLSFGLSFKRTQIYGVIVGFLGSVLLVFNGAIHHPEQNYYFSIFVIIASICYAVNVNLIKKYLADLSPLAITTGNFAVMLLPAILIISFSGIDQTIDLEKTQHSIFYILLLGVLGTGIANIIFFKLIQISSPVFATSVTYLIPIVAFFWGLLDNEMLTPIQFLGAFIILVGVYLSSKK
jgi:drug/metabolite transporter (DMT)-like permease